jgi:hypothetical protein
MHWDGKVSRTEFGIFEWGVMLSDGTDLAIYTTPQGKRMVVADSPKRPRNSYYAAVHEFQRMQDACR